MNSPAPEPAELRDLPRGRLSTTDAEGRRLWLYPTEVSGFYRNWRTALHAVLIVVFLVLPWIRVRGYQALLLDISHRRFAIFGITFWAHDAPMLAFVFGGAILTLALVTAIYGRIWCGWACPQTVFIDSVFRRIERWIEGDALAQRRLDLQPMNGSKAMKKGLKWFVFAGVSAVISHSFLAYFVGTQALGRMMDSAPSENPLSFAVMIFISAVILFDFGWFREQFCTLVCPYGRFQSVLMDAGSLAVLYDVKRGEPRRGSGSGGGDCVNCDRCVRVCPTGIDIRQGVQMECIGCTACMDACNDVMARLKKPLGLIRYSSISLLESARTGKALPRRFRPWAYLFLVTACVGGLGITVFNRTRLTIEMVRPGEAPYQELQAEDGHRQILNHYKLDLRNQSFHAQRVEIVVPPEFAQRGVKIVISNHSPILASGASERCDLFIRFPVALLELGKGGLNLDFHASDQENTFDPVETIRREVRLVGPFI